MRVIYDILDDQFFAGSNNYEYQLAMFVAHEELSYLIYNQQSILAYKSYAFEGQESEAYNLKNTLSAILHQDKLLGLSFRRVLVSYMQPHFTFIPEALFDENKLNSYIANTIQGASNDPLRTDAVRRLQFRNIYPVRAEIAQFFKSSYSVVLLKHAGTTLCEAWAADAVNRVGQKIYLNFGEKHLQIAAFDGQKFLLFNNFEFNSASDVTYFVLLVINQLRLNADTIQVFVTGKILNDSEIWRTLYRFLPHLAFLEHALLLQVSESFEAKLPRHIWGELVGAL
jgi:Protein of unknown function (DUF3822)